MDKRAKTGQNQSRSDIRNWFKTPNPSPDPPDSEVQSFSMENEIIVFDDVTLPRQMNENTFDDVHIRVVPYLPYVPFQPPLSKNSFQPSEPSTRGTL